MPSPALRISLFGSERLGTAVSRVLGAESDRPLLFLVPPQAKAHASLLLSFTRAIGSTPELLDHRVLPEGPVVTVAAADYFRARTHRGESDFRGKVLFIDSSGRYVDERTTVFPVWRSLGDLLSSVGEAVRSVGALAGVTASASSFQPAYVRTEAFSGSGAVSPSENDTVGYSMWIQAPGGTGNDFAALKCLSDTRAEMCRLHDCAVEAMNSGGAVHEVEAAVVALARRWNIPIYSL